MAITVDWSTKVIFVPKADLTLISGSVYELDVDWLRLQLKAIEASENGLVFLDTHQHNTSVVLSGVTYARVITFLDPYTIEFEDGNYTVSCIGANHNIADVKVVNSVSLIVNNSAGLIDINKEDIEYGAYNGRITIDVINGGSGVDHPWGTARQPVNNLADAKTISSARAIDVIFVIGDLTVGASESLNDLEILAASSNSTIITLTSGCTTDKTIFSNVCIKDSLNGTLMRFNVCDLHPDGVTGLQGEAHKIGFAGSGPYVLGGVMTLVDSFTIRAEEALRPVLNINGQISCAIRGHAGPFEITGVTAPNSIVCIDVLSGFCVLQSGNTDGVIALRDGMEYQNSSNGTTVLEQTTSFLTTEFLERSVWIDTEQVAAGDGSQANPFNTLTAAIDFAEAEGIKTLYIYADITLDRQLKNFKIIGVGTPTVDTNGQDLTKSEFWHCKMQGNYTGIIIVQEGVLLNNFYLNGFFEKNGLAGNLICVDGSDVLLTDCMSVIAGLGRPTISMNGAGSSKLSIRSNRGGLTIKDCNNALDEVTVEVAEGSLTFDSSNTDGIMVARGMCKFVDNSNGSTVFDETGNPANINIQDKILRNKTETDPVTGVMTVYDDDDVTVLFTANIWENVAATTPYNGNAVNRKDRLT